MTELVDRIQGLSGSLAFKPPVRVATTANIVLNGLGTVDGVALAAGDRVLVRAQTDTTEHGIYDTSTSDWQRSLDFNGANDLTKGTLVLVTDGTAYGITTWHVSTTGPAIGSALAFTRVFIGTSESVAYLPAGSGAVETDVRSKLRLEPDTSDYSTNIQYLDACKALATHQHFAQNGAKIKRIPDRLFLGGAINNDGAFPCVEQDWLTQYQRTLNPKIIVGVAKTGVTTAGSPVITFTAGGSVPSVGAILTATYGVPDGARVLTVDSTTQVTLDANATLTTTNNTFYSNNANTLQGTGLSAALFATNSDSPASALPCVFGSHSENFTAAGASCIAIAGFAVNDNATLATNSWGGYFEAHRLSSTVGAARGVEIDVASWAATEITPNPFQQSQTDCLQLGAGNGLSSEGQTDIGAAIQIVSNPKKFKAGIVFLADSLTGADGVTGTGTAISMATGHAISWFNKSEQLVGRIFSVGDLTSAQKTEIRFTSAGVQFLGDTGQVLGYFTPVADAVNYMSIAPAATGTSPGITATGTDADIDFRLICKGTGVIRFGTHTGGGDVACNGYITIKDSAGTTRKLMTTA